MILRLRRVSPVVISGMLMLLAVAFAVGAQPTQAPAPTWPEISLAIWLRYGAAVATSIAATWVLMAGYERRQDVRHKEIQEALSKAANALQRHDSARHAHPDMIEKLIEDLGEKFHHRDPNDSRAYHRSTDDSGADHRPERGMRRSLIDDGGGR